MAATDELLVALMRNCKRPADLIGERGQLKQLLTKSLERPKQAEMTEQPDGQIGRMTEEVDMSIKWGESFATGVAEIDQQHQELFARLDKMLQAVEQGTGQNVLQDLFTYLDSYTREHFAAEESLQRKINYPHVAVHCEEHKHFISNLERLKSRIAIEEPGEADVKLVRDTLVNWLVTHICATDRHFGDFVKEQQQSMC